MKKRKKLAALALCFALICSLLPQVSLNVHAETLSGNCGEDGDNLTWTLDTESGLLSIEGSGAMGYYDPYNGQAAPWYDYRMMIKEISFPSTMTSVGAYAFTGCSSLTELTVPEGVTLIDWAAFSGCTALSSVSLPKSLTEIGIGAFGSCSSLTSVEFSEGLKTVNENAFISCSALKKVTIPASVTKIGNCAFGYWYDDGGNLAKVSGFTIYGYPNTAAQTYATNNSFSFVSLSETNPPDPDTTVSGSCGSELTWTLNTATGLLTVEGSGDMYNYDFMEAPWGEYREVITAVMFPDGLTSIGNQAFKDCVKLKNLVLPEGLQYVRNQAFSGCTGLTELALPEDLIEIDYQAFSGCTGLTELFVPDGLWMIAEQAFVDCTALTTVQIADSLTQIGIKAFGYYFDEEGNAQKVKNLKIYGVLSSRAQIYAENNVFPFFVIGEVIPTSGNCGAEGDNLTWSMNTETGVLTISGNGAMADYEEFTYPWKGHFETITAVSLSDGVTHIGRAAFYACFNLTDVVLPNSLKSIGSGAFCDCAALETITLPDGVESIGASAFQNCTGLKNVKLPAGLKELQSDTFHSCKSLTSVILQEGLTCVGNDSFHGCAALTAVNFPKTLTVIENNAFEGCNGLTSAVLPENLTRIGNFAFSSCASLTNVSFQTGLKIIGDAAFCNCSSLSEVTFADGLEEVNYEAFFCCPALSSVTIPASVTKIGSYAFGMTQDSETQPISAVENFTIYGTWGSEAQSYADSNSLRFVPVDGYPTSGTCGMDGDNLTWSFDEETNILTISGSGEMDWYDEKQEAPWTAFREMIIAVEFPDGLKSIGSYAFFGCTGLTAITVSNGVDAIYDNAFNGCTGLSSVSFPESLMQIDMAAFFGCTALTEVQLPSELQSVGALAFVSTGMTSVKIPVTLCMFGYDCFGYYEDEETDELKKVKGFTVYGIKGSEAETYANENEFLFVSEQANNPFADVAEDDYFFVPVMWAVANHMTVGVGGGRFGSHDGCTREQIVTLLWKASGSPEPYATECSFSDVAPDDYFYRAVIWAEERQITAGIGNGKFGVGSVCTRAEAMTFLWAAMGRQIPQTTENPFTDLPDEGVYYHDAVLWAYENGLTVGIGNGLFGVNDTCTRAQIMTFLYKTMLLSVRR